MTTRTGSSVKTATIAADLVELEVEPPVAAETDAVTSDLEPRDESGMADPENAHSPMSPDDQVSESHTGLHTEEHSTSGNTPAS